MKLAYLVVILNLFFLNHNVYGQKKINDYDEPEEITDTTVFTFVDEWPEFTGGNEARNHFLSDSITYPSNAIEVQGRVIIGFIVERDGSLSNFKILKSVHPSLDSEALRVVTLMPKWKPARYKGKIVRSKFKIDIVYKH